MTTKAPVQPENPTSIVEDYIRSLTWAPELLPKDKLMIAMNLRAFAAFIANHPNKDVLAKLRQEFQK